MHSFRLQFVAAAAAKTKQQTTKQKTKDKRVL